MFANENKNHLQRGVAGSLKLIHHLFGTLSPTDVKFGRNIFHPFKVVAGALTFVLNEIVNPLFLSACYYKITQPNSMQLSLLLRKIFQDWNVLFPTSI